MRALGVGVEQLAAELGEVDEAGLGAAARAASASRRASAAAWVREPGRGLPTTATTRVTQRLRGGHGEPGLRQARVLAVAVRQQVHRPEAELRRAATRFARALAELAAPARPPAAAQAPSRPAGRW